ncbi:MAG: quinone-dependent dihydroorotate dehydrogenase [Hyphomicrobiaceae bacterium]|nr:MAG: quinone-dependent dihydroorotate dehydrogenase [Hyphomicrobiaceae bacterium]KAB2851820.1 MAG: quinone-dependent dihydroorotate dehydrogenase [Hyphomicrobiaceae bacterium]
MLGAVFDLARPLLYALEPEQAHELTLRSLEAGLYPHPAGPDDPRLAVGLWGLAFPNPFGVAAGFDKDARVPDALLGMGFGYAEIGSVTPLPQEGNPRPRVFRLIEDRAVINRLGFNNAGHAAALERLRRHRLRGIVGVNVGANKNAADRTADYVAGIRLFYDVASYFTVNISSPNTPGLRDLQAPAALDGLLARVLEARAELMAAGKPRRPIVVKIAPDLADDDVEPIVQVLLARAVDGIAVSNTTLSRAGVSDADFARRQAGGLSGRPLFHRSTVMLARVHRASEGRIPLIGIGGIDSGAAAIAKIEAGASLLQLYTGLIYEGPGLLARMKEDLVAYVERNKLARLVDAAGRRSAEWAARPLDSA